MVRRWVWIMAIGLVLAGGAWKPAAGDTLYLAKLKSLCVPPAFFGPETEKFEAFGLSKEAIADYAYVWLKSKLPRLTLERERGRVCYPPEEWGKSIPRPFLTIQVNVGQVKLMSGTQIAYCGNVSIRLTRLTTWEGGELRFGIAFIDGSTIFGPASTIVSRVNKVLEDVLTDFAVEYYKAGNP